MMKEMTMLKTLEMLVEKGIGKHERQLASVKKNGKLANKKQVEAVERSLSQLYQEFEIIKGTGKSAIVKVGKAHDTIQERDDNRGGCSREKALYYQKQGVKCDLFDRLEKDRSFRHKLHEYFQTKRVSKQMFYAYYFGFDQVYFEDWSAYSSLSKQEINKRKKKTQENFNNKYVVYRFINNEKISYVGLSSDFKRRIYQHKYAGHLKQELYDSVERIEYIELETEVDMNIAEIYFIAKFKPAWNSSRTYDGKLGIAIEELDNLEWKTLDFSLKTVI